MNALRLLTQPWLLLALLVPHAAFAAKPLAGFAGKYTVSITLNVNGQSIPSTATAIWTGKSGGRAASIQITSVSKGAQGTPFAASPTLKLTASQQAVFSDLSMGVTGGKAAAGKGTWSGSSSRITIKASHASGWKLTARAVAPKKGGKGKLSLAIRAANPSLPLPIAYAVAAKTLVSNAVTHSYVLARPKAVNGPLPLVIGFHGDGGDGAGLRKSLRLEDQLRGRAIVAYLDAIGGTFEYYTQAGRDKEAAVVTRLIADLDAAGLIRTDRVFLTGMSGGATMINAIGFRLGPNVIRGLGIMSGSLYAINNDLPAQIPGNPTLPPALIIWGKADTSGGTEYATSGIGTRDAYLAAYQATNPTPAAPSPTVIYSGTPADIWWCAVPGMGHAVAPQAAEALWAYFASRL